MIPDQKITEKKKALNRTRYNKQCPNLLYLLLRSRPFSKALRFYYNNESHHPIKFIIVCFGFFLTQELGVTHEKLYLQ